MFDSNGLYNNQEASRETQGLQRPWFNDSSLDLERVVRLNGLKNSTERVSDPIAFIKSSLASLKLLSRDEERTVASRLAHAGQAIALLTVAWNKSALELLSLVDEAVNMTLKIRMFSSDVAYFALRRELDELVSGNREVLPRLVEIGKSNIEHSNRLSLALVELSSSVEWPGPLMIALANRVRSKVSTDSILELAVDEYLVQKNENQHSGKQPCDRHKDQLLYFISEYLDSRDTLVNHNLKLVFHIAKKYAQKSDHLPDLIQEGTVGLIRAAEKFRLDTGYRFSTYAYQWIDSKISKARVNIDKVMPISDDCNNDLLRISKCLERHKIAGSRPNFSELARESKVPENRLGAVMQANQYSLSFDQTPADSDGLSLNTKLADPGSNFVETILQDETAEYLNVTMRKVLTERELYVINERFGRLGSDPKTLREISPILGISRERVRQLEACALKKLAGSLDVEQLL